MHHFQQKVSGRYEVHVYQIRNVNTYFYDDLKLAKFFADRCFRNPLTYKVNVWDTEKGKVEPNNHRAKGLVYQLI